MKRFSFWILLLCLSTGLWAQTSFKDVQYVNDGDVKHTLDIYIPANTSQAMPLVVFIHGGGWSGGSKGSAAGWVKTMLNNNGYVCADINYRLSRDSVWPAQLYDCKAAIRFLKANAQKYFIDTCRVGVMGTSAGGHLSSVVATTGNYPPLEGAHLGNAHVSSKVHAALPAYGPVDFFQMDDYLSPTCTTSFVHSYNSPETMLLGCDTLKNCPARVISANPTTYLDANDPPMYITHGSADCSVPMRQSIVLDSIARARGVPTQLVIVDSIGHGGPYWTTQSQQIIYQSFFDTALKVCQTTGIHTPNSNYKAIIYPNPSNSNIIYFETGNAIEELVIFNTLGQIVYSAKNINANVAVNTAIAAKGVYIATYLINGQWHTEKLILE